MTPGDDPRPLAGSEWAGVVMILNSRLIFLMVWNPGRLLWPLRCFAAGVLAFVIGSPAVAADAGIRKLTSKHLTLFTDLPSSPEVDELPKVFDLAFPQWCAYFGLDPAKHADWHPRGYLMKSKERFIAAGMLAADSTFPNGFSRDLELWLYEQTSPYYRRHLLLHEGTHCFMNTKLGTCGPPWYAEGMAELLATHRWDQEQLVLNYFPRKRSEVPKLGRIEIARTGYGAGKGLTLDKIMEFDYHAHSDNNAYGWCWAAAAFLDGHPRYRARFRELPKALLEPDFPQHVRQVFAADWPLLLEEWQIYVANLDYGYDFGRMRLLPATGKPLPDGGAKVSVAADLGWQASGLRLEAGRTYQLQASGRYQVADKPRAWLAEPGGVTLRYYNGLPLGALVAAVRPDNPKAGDLSPLIRPVTVGTAALIVPKQSGTLYLRLNDSAGRMGDNSGSAAVEISPPAAQRDGS